MPKKILIIEDSQTDAAVIKGLLADEKLDVDVAYSGNEGLRKAIEMKPDLVILDIKLPDIDGIDVCAKIKKEKSLSQTIVVILTINDNMPTIKRAFNADADDYIIKPPEAQFLVKKIKLYLGIK